jgi:hypothetical protein
LSAEDRRGDDDVRVVELKLEGISPHLLHQCKILSEYHPSTSHHGQSKGRRQATRYQRRIRLLKKVSPLAPHPPDHLLGGLTKGTAGDRLALRRSTRATYLQREIRPAFIIGDVGRSSPSMP